MLACPRSLGSRPVPDRPTGVSHGVLHCRYFETFSHLPPLTDDQIARQVDYIVNNGWTPCLEFSEPEIAYTAQYNTIRFGAVASVSTQFLLHCPLLVVNDYMHIGLCILGHVLAAFVDSLCLAPVNCIVN